MKFLNLVYKLHCDGRDWVSAHGMPSMNVFVKTPFTLKATFSVLEQQLLTNTTRDSRLLSKSYIKQEREIIPFENLLQWLRHVKRQDVRMIINPYYILLYLHFPQLLHRMQNLFSQTTKHHIVSRAAFGNRQG